MSNLVHEYIYTHAIGRYGKQAQILVAIEEMAELTKALCKNINRGEDNLENILEEIADVEIMVEQLKVIYDRDGEQTSLHKSDKLRRLAKELNI